MVGFLSLLVSSTSVQRVSYFEGTPRSRRRTRAPCGKTREARLPVEPPCHVLYVVLQDDKPCVDRECFPGLGHDFHISTEMVTHTHTKYGLNLEMNLWTLGNGKVIAIFPTILAGPLVPVENGFASYGCLFS